MFQPIFFCPSLKHMCLRKIPLPVLHAAADKHCVDEFTLHTEAARVIQRAWRYSRFCNAIIEGCYRGRTSWQMITHYLLASFMTSSFFMSRHGRQFRKLIDNLLSRPTQQLYRVFATIVLIAFRGEYPHRAHELLTRRMTRHFLLKAFEGLIPNHTCCQMCTVLYNTLKTYVFSWETLPEWDEKNYCQKVAVYAPYVQAYSIIPHGAFLSGESSKEVAHTLVYQFPNNKAWLRAAEICDLMKSVEEYKNVLWLKENMSHDAVCTAIEDAKSIRVFAKNICIQWIPQYEAKNEEQCFDDYSDDVYCSDVLKRASASVRYSAGEFAVLGTRFSRDKKNKM